MAVFQQRLAIPRPVATIKKLSTSRVVQRHVLTRTIGHSETGFLGQSSDSEQSSVNGVRDYETGVGFATHPRLTWIGRFPFGFLTPLVAEENLWGYVVARTVFVGLDVLSAAAMLEH